MIYQMALDDLLWEKPVWKSFCKYAKRRYKDLRFPAQGIVDLCDDSGRLSEQPQGADPYLICPLSGSCMNG